MADIYGEFDDSDDLEDNDEEFGALGSILSWDDEDDQAGRAPDNDLPQSLPVKSAGTPLPGVSSVTGTTSLPPGLVSFSLTKDANGQLYYSQVPNASNGVNNTANLGTDQAAGLTMPNPTLINFAQEQVQNAQMTQDQAQQQQADHQAQQQQQQAQQQQAQQIQQIVSAPVTLQHGLTQANFALFQQNGAILQQVNLKQPQQQQPLSIRPAPTIQGMVLQQVGQQQQLQQVQQQIQPQQQQVQMQPQQVQQLQNPQQIQVQVQQVPQQQVQQIQQQLQQQFAITGDANAFLRQLQVAQIQQQFNALQQQGGLTQSSLGTAQQQAVLQQQLQQLQRVQVPLVAVQASQQQVPSQPIQQAPVAAAPVSLPPRAKASSKASALKARSTTTRKKAPPAVGVVSASDTDGELSSRGVKSNGKKSPLDGITSSKKRKPLLEEEPFDTSNMSPGEKAKANRDRNREHARNTRLRKKAYLEKLKVTVDELCKERDTLVSERAGAANLLVEMHNTRTEVLMSFFALRSMNEKRRKLWASILDESCFACVMPVTPYRSFPASEVQVSKCQRTVLGIDGMMADTASLHVLLSSLVDRSRFPHGKIEFCYTLVTEEAVVAGNQMMARWVMSTLNATQCGARMEVAKQGMLCCKFNSAHRITGLELMFDVMALMLQLKQAAGSESFSVIPNTVQTCQRSFDKPMVMTLAEGPYTIVQVNQLWENMTGYKAEEVVGKTSCSLLQGQMTNKAALQDLMNEVRFKRAASVMLINYTKAGEQFRNFVVVFPLSTDSRITHYLALTSFVERVTDKTGEGNSNVVVSQTNALTSLQGFNSGGTIAAPASAGQMHQMLQNQAQAIQQGNAVAAQQHHSALANAASAALIAQSNAPAGHTVPSTGIQGQMLPPVNTTAIAQQKFPV